MQFIFCSVKLQQNTFKKSDFSASQEERGVMSQEGPQVENTVTRVTSKCKWGHNPEPCKSWRHTARPAPHFHKKVLPCREEARGWSWMSGAEEKRKVEVCFLKSLLSHSG